MKKQIAKLFDIKCVVALIMVLVYCYIIVIGTSVDESFKSIMLVIVGYLFGSSKKENQPE